MKVIKCLGALVLGYTLFTGCGNEGKTSLKGHSKFLPVTIENYSISQVEGKLTVTFPHSVCSHEYVLREKSGTLSKEQFRVFHVVQIGDCQFGHVKKLDFSTNEFSHKKVTKLIIGNAISRS